MGKHKVGSRELVSDLESDGRIVLRASLPCAKDRILSGCLFSVCACVGGGGSFSPMFLQQDNLVPHMFPSFFFNCATFHFLRTSQN